MEIITVVVIAFVSILILPIILIVCVDAKESDGEPKLRSHKKQGSAKQVDSKRNSTKSNGSSQGKSKTDDKEEVTVITNVPAVAAYEEVGGVLENVKTARNAYEEPEAFVPNPQQINSVLTNGGPTSPTVAVVNETSPASSQRSSRTSGGQPRVVSQDRALPEIPGLSSRHSTGSERSPSTKRALPELPSADDEGANLYDQLERDLPPHQIRSKGSSDSSSVKMKLKLPLEEGRLGLLADDGSTEMLIEPDEVTRNSSVFMSPNASDLYSLPGEAGPGTAAKPSDSSKPKEHTKPKAKVQYSKVKKDSSTDKDPKSPGTQTLKIVDSAEPLYTEAPPVPVKLYDINAEVVEDGTGAAAAAVIVDEHAQDSGSGYYAVTDDGPAAPNNAVPPPLPTSTHADLPENYNVLSARESIAVVRARQDARYEAEDDYYESMDDKPSVGAPISQTARCSSPTELYAEIDNPPSASAAASSAQPTNFLRPPSVNKRLSGDKEELYAEIDSPQLNGTVPNGASSIAFNASNVPDPGYEKVNFEGAKGGQVDSAGYAIVKESNAATAAAAATPMLMMDDEDDYAECDPPPVGPGSLPPSVVNERLLRNDSDLSDYATVADAIAPSQPQPPNGNERRPYQRYRKREHLYQEIDEVRIPKSPPDKKN